MAEQIEEQISEGVVSGGDGGKGKNGVQIAAENRVNLYNEILSLKEPGFSDVYKKAGFKKFDALLKDNQEFQSELLNDLIDRGFKIDPANFSAAYTNIKPVNVYELPKEEISDTPQPLEKDDEGKSIYDKFSTFSALKNMAKNVYNYGKESLQTLSTFGKRGTLTGLAGMGAQAENFATGTVDTRNLAKYLKQAHEVGTTQLEADFAKDDGMWQDSWDMAKILVPSMVESFANMFAAGSKKISGATALGALGGGTYGTFIAPGVGSAAGALVGGSRALQYAMLQQGYNLEFVGTVIDELQTKKLINMDADEKTLENQLKTAFSNKELMAPIFKKANIRASAITGVDFIFSGMGTAVARNLAKSKIAGSVLNTPAGKLLSTLAETTVANPAYRRTARLANRVAQIDRKIQGSKLGKAGATVGVGDIMGGAAGETLAQSLTQDNLDYKSIAVEGLSEGKLINTLRQLGSIGERRNVEAALANVAEGKPPGNEDDEFVAVTQQELDDYKKGNITPERAAGVKDDLDIALGNANHINKLAVADPLYAEMVKDAYNKAIKAFENQKLYGVAVTEMTTLHNLDENGVKEAINPSSSSFNPKVANDFKNTLNVLQQQYKKETGDDSKDTTRVSSEVGGGAESEQTKSQQGASEEEAGDGRVVQEAADEVRLSDIDEMLADDDDFFNQSGDRLLSPEERQDLEQEKARLTGGAVTTTQQTGVANAPIQEGTQQTGGVSPQPLPTEVVSNTGVTAAPQGQTTQQPAATTEVAVGKTVPGQGGGAVVKPTFNKKTTATFELEGNKITPNQTPGAYDSFRMTISDDGQYATYEIDPSLQRGYNELLSSGPKLTFALFETSKKLGNKNSFETVNPGTLKKMPDGSWQIIKKAQVNAYQTVAPSDKNEPTFSPRPLSFEESQPAAPKPAPAATTTTTTAATTTAAEPKTEEKPAPKEIKPADVEIRKGKTHDKDGVYEAVYKGKVIGKMLFDKKEKVWVDAAGDKFAQKKDAVNKFVLRYNMVEANKPSTKPAKAKTKTETKTETKGETKTEKKSETKAEPKTEEKPKAKTEKKSETKTETKGETKTETKAEGKQEVKTEPKAETTSTNQNDIAATAKALEGKDLTKINSLFADYFGIVEMFKDFKEAVGFNVRRAAKINLDESSANYGQLVDVNLVKKALKTIGINIEVVGKDKLANNNYAQARNGVIEVSETKIPLSVLLHEIGEAVLTELDKKSKIKHANNIFEAITTYGASRANDAFSDNFYLYFLSPSTLKDLSPNVYNELNAEIPSNLKSAVKELLKQNNVVEQTLKYKKGDTSFIAEAYYKAKEEGSNPELVKAVEELLGVKTETKPATPSANVAPTFAEFDAISADRGKMKEAKAAFIEKHGQLAYDAMKEISANFTKITKALQEKEILTKKC